LPGAVGRLADVDEAAALGELGDVAEVDRFDVVGAAAGGEGGGQGVVVVAVREGIDLDLDVGELLVEAGDGGLDDTSPTAHREAETAKAHRG